MEGKHLDPNKIKKYFKNQIPPSFKELKAASQKYEDPYFPPNNSSIVSKDKDGNFTDEVNGPQNLLDLDDDYPGASTDLEWKRVTDISPTWDVFGGKIEFNDVKQGDIGDCYFLSSISAIAEYSYLIREKFRTSKFNELGYYEVIFFIDGEWQIVFVDDYFPYDPKKKDFAFARPQSNELWAIILEKAWAKVNGGYSNIIGGVVNEPISALTGFPTDILRHNKMDPDELFNEIKDADEAGTIMSSASKSENQIERKGLVQGHAYTLITAKSYENEEEEKELYLVKLRNPWGDTEWTGDWGDNSRKWTDELKKYFNLEKKEDGIFWIDINDYVKNFEATFICYLLYDSVIKNFYFEYERYFKNPVIFNIYISEKSRTSISLFFKGWRFNREFNDHSHPALIVLGNYDDNKQIKNLTCKWEYDDDISMIEDLDPGKYVLWIYVAYDLVKEDSNFKYTLSICSLKNFVVEYIGLDEQFLLIQQLILENYKNEGQASIASSKDYYLGTDNEIKKRGLNSILIYNKSNKWLKVDSSAKKIENVQLLPPYSNMKNISLLIPPKQSTAILGIRTSNEARVFTFKNSVSLKTLNNEIIPQPDVFGTYLKNDIKENSENSGPRTGEYKYIDKQHADRIPLFDKKKFLGDKILDMYNKMPKVTESSLKNEYPKEMDILLKKFKGDIPADNVKRKWNKITNDDGVYIGEINETTGNLHGRGIFIWDKTQTKYIGYLNEGNFDIEGMLLDKNNKIIYEGEYTKGKRSGKGTLFIIPEEEYCKGTFINGFLEGNGKYFFKNGDVWEGNFSGSSKNGVGMMIYKDIPNKKFVVEYENDNFIRKVDIEENERKELEKQREEELKKEKEQKSEFIKKMSEDLDDKGIEGYQNQQENMPQEIQNTPGQQVPGYNNGPWENQNQVIPSNYQQQYQYNQYGQQQYNNWQQGGYYQDPNNGNYWYNNNYNQYYPGYNQNQQGNNNYNYNNYNNNYNYNNYGYPQPTYPQTQYIDPNNYQNPNQNINYGGYNDPHNQHGGDHGHGHGHGGYPQPNPHSQDYSHNQGMDFHGHGQGFLPSINQTITSPIFVDRSIKPEQNPPKIKPPRGFIGNIFHDLKSEFIRHKSNRTFFFNKVGDKFIKNKAYFQQSILILNNDKEVVETEEEKKKTEHLEKIKLLREKDSFMMEEVLNIQLDDILNEELEYIEYDQNIKSKYIGAVINKNIRHGRGALFDGTFYYIGIFENGYPSQTSKFKKYDSKKIINFIGFLNKNFQINNYGTIFNKDGSKYRGSINEQGQPNGYGTFFYANGNSWTGTFTNGLFNGVGKYYYHNALISQVLTYNQNQIVSSGNFEKVDYSISGADSFFNTLNKEYPFLVEKLLLLSPYRDSDDQLMWKIIKLNNGNVYAGQTKLNGDYHGKGCLIFHKDNIRYYVGYFEDNMFSKFGNYYDEKMNCLYIGQFKKNKKMGKGCEYYADGSYYVGNFSNDLTNGKGVYYFPGGSRYEGLFENGEKNGKGYFINDKYTTKQEIFYEHSNVIEQGRVIRCDAPRFFKKRSKKEISELNNIYAEYTNMFLNLKPTKDHNVLEIKMKESSGGIYIGEMNTIGYKHGRGVLLKPNSNEFYVGYFSNDYKEGEGTIYYNKNNPKFIGNFSINKMNGKGKYFKENGDVIEGIFNEAGEGDGTYTFKDGSYWKGHFYAWVLDGNGEYYDRNGKFIGMKNYKLNNLIR